jgi:hypothetical protein
MPQNLGLSGTIYVLQNASSGTTFQPNSLLSIDPTTGMVSTVFSNTATSGPTPGINVGGFTLLPGGLAAFTATGSSLAGNGGVYLYNFATGKATLLVQGGPLTTAPPVQGAPPEPATPGAVAVLPNGQLLAASTYFPFPGASEESSVFEIDPTTGAVKTVGSFIQGGVGKIAVTADGSTAFLGGVTTRLGAFLDGFDLASGTTTSILGGFGNGVETIYPAVFTPEPSSLALTGVGIGLLTLAARRARNGKREDRAST